MAGALAYAVIAADYSPLGVAVATATPTTYASLPDFTASYVSDASLFTVDRAAGSITYQKEGLYIAEAAVQFDAAFAGTKIVNVEWAATSFDVQAIWTEELEISSDHCHAQSLVFPQGEGFGVTASFEQRSGVGQFLLRCSLKVCRLIEYPIAGGVAFP